MDRIFSGVQPTGNLHIGNYLGAIKNFVEIQKRKNIIKSYYCVVDLHAITVWQNPKKLKNDTLETAAAFIASGINPTKSIIFNQSRVSSHAELAWILNCICRIGWLNRMTQFKEKAGKNREQVSVGLYAYPVLMASDILSYKSTLVPVGDDQKQHLELARDIANKFNYDYGVNFFPEIKPLIFGGATRVMSLRDGNKKMSKSDDSEYSRINLVDEADIIRKKIRKAKTDSGSIMDLKSLDDKGEFKSEVICNRPEAVNLINIFCATENKTKRDIIEKFMGKNFSNLKESLADSLINKIAPIGKEMKKMMQDSSYLESILKEGAEIADEDSKKNLFEIKNIIGLN
ncbi:MAG: Tryptophan--tRNA ligase [Alphaproteobacteria bacterium MarineAlpha9_Bin4]|nr:tryptophan--tRNA ligase [Pelagibacterales bacterium]PPR26099.1 MAG: Tryptophan--tRNA ligase [Alphaproteobacteria bacterium MarineAlpha9_Bin4]